MPNNNELNPLTGLPVGTKVDAKDIKLPSSITGNIENAAQSELLTTDPLSKYTDRGIDVVPNTNLREKLADSQGVLEQAKNSVVGGTLSGLATAVQDFSYIPQLFSSHWEENAVSDAMIRAKEGIDEELPIYTKTDGMFDWNDGAFVWKALKGTLDSAIGFGLPGGVIAGSLEKIGKVAKLEKLVSLLSKSPKVYEAMMSLGTGYVMNRMEGTMMGVELYNKSMKEMEGDIASGKITQADAERVASQKADEFRNWNTMFAITDAIGVHGIIKGYGFTRNLKTKGWGLTEMSMENPILQAIKEGGEEIGQNIIQSEKEYETYKDLGLNSKAMALSNKKDLVGRIVDFGTSQQALYEGMLGLVGGYPQHLFSKIASGAYTKEGIAKEEDYYNAQQKTIADTDAYLKNFNDINLKYTELKLEAEKRGDAKAVEALDKMSFTNTAIKNFSNGTTEHLERGLDDIINLSPEKAQERGYGPDYVSKAKALKKEMLTLENDWLHTSKYINHEEVFLTKQTAKVHQMLYNNELEKSQAKENEVNLEANRLVQKYNAKIAKDLGHDVLGLSFDLNTMETPSLSSNLVKPYYNEMIAELKGTPAYDDYFSHKTSDLETTRQALDNVNNHYKTITSSKYQEAVQSLSETIKEKKKEAEAKTKKEEAKAKHKEVVAKVKEKVAAVVTPKVTVEKTPVTTPDLNTPISLGNIQQEEEIIPTPLSREDMYSQLEDLYNTHDALLQSSNPDQNKLAEIGAQIQKLEEEINKTEATEATSQDNNTSSKEELEAKKADIERLKKEKQETLKPLIEEKEQIEKEIEEIEKDSKSSKTNSQEIESLKEKIKDLRNTDGTIPENKLNEFRSLRKQIQFLESDILHNINKAINEFISDNNLTEKDKKLIYALAEIRDNFQEVIDEFNEKRNSNYTLSEIMTFFGSSFNLQESIETETETDNKKAHEYENKLLEGNGFKANEDYTADELNDFVQKHGSKQVKFIWNLIKAVAQKLGVTTRFMLQGNSKIPVGAAGHYLNGKIENRASLFSHPESAARIIVHELVHGVTTYILKAVEQNNTKILSKLTTRQLKAVEKLNALFDELKKDKEFDDTYGTKNTHELLAELTNENFVDKLKSKNVFEKILEAIFEIFNIPFNAYNESVKILEDLISNPLEDNRYEGSLGEGYSLYSKSESTKLQQLKQKLAEVNKKINEVTKRFNAQIVQKQSELKALEQQNTSNQSETEAKKADIKERRQDSLHIVTEEDLEKGDDIGLTEENGVWKGYYFNDQNVLKESFIGTKEEVIAKVNAKYDEEYIDKVRKGEFTAQQAKDALKEINRLTPELSKQLDDAELKALENNSELTPTEETVVVQTDAQQEEVTANEISQQEYTDDTNDDVEETNIATENFVEKEDLEEEEYFKSEFGSNILAYLSRLYNGFTSREDIDNLLNEELKDKSILDPDKFQPGTKITLRVKDNDATDMYIPGTKDKTTWGEYKIAHPEIKVGTEAYNNLVPIVILDTNGNEIADLHTTDWIRTENIFGDVQEDSIRLSKIRKHILANNGKLDSIITRKTNGKLFKLINGAKETIAKAFPDKNLHIVYSKKGELKNVPTKVAEATNMQFVKDGITYIVVPVNKNSYIPLPLQQKKVSTEIAQSITTAISIWYKAKGTASNLDSNNRAIAEAIYTETGLNITQNEDLRKYVTLFINSYDIPAEIEAKIPKDSKESKLKIYLEGTSVKSTTHLLSITGNTIDFGTGAKFTGSLFHSTPENVANDLIGKLTSHIENMYLHINHSLLTKDNVKMHIINSDGTLSDINNNGSYKDFVRNNTETKYLSHNIGTEENPKYVYTIQPVIEYDTSFVDDANTRINNELQAERNGTKTEITKANENIAKITNPLTGEEININKDSFDEDFLPLTDEQASVVVNSFKNTILVPGLTANQQQEIVNDIAYLLQRKVLEANGKTINGRDVHTEYKAYLESLLAITTGKRKEVIQAVIDNYKSIENISYKYFSKLQGVQVKENVDNLFSKNEEDTKVNVDEETDISNETESNLEKTTFEDSSLTQNYKNTISSRLKKFLSFIKTGEKNFVYSPQFVPFDEVYNTLKQVLSGERPDFDGMIKELEKNVISKPWLQDVVTQLNAAPGETKNDFVSAMTSHTVNMTFLMWQKDANDNYKLTPYSSNSVSISNMVIDNWYETGKLAAVVIDKEGELVYNPEVVARYKVAVQNLKDKKLEDITVTDVANTFATIGIELHPDALKTFLSKGLSGQSFKSHLISKTGIFANLSNKLSSTNDIVTDNYLGDKSITKLAYLEAKFNKNVTDGSFKSGTKSISAHTLNKHITNQVRELKNNRKLVTDMLSISFSKDSSLLKGLVFTEVNEDVKNEAEKVTGSREVTVNKQGVVIASDGQILYNKDSYFYQNFNFDYLGIEAIKEFGKSSKDGSELKNLSAAEHELIKIGLFMKSSLTQDSKGNRVAQMFYPTMSDKTTMINITTLLHNVTYGLDGTLSNKTVDALFDALVLPEYNRMVNYHGAKNIKGYDKGHSLFYFLPQLNDRKELFHADGTIKDLSSDKDALIIIKNEIRNTVEDLVKGKLTEWETYKFTKDDYLDADYMKNTAKKNIKYAATDYVVNYLIHNSNMFQAFIGDPALYFKSDSDNNMSKIEDTFINIGKRLAGDIAPGYEINNAYKDTFKAAIIADRKSVSESIDYYTKVLKEKGAEAYTKIEAGDAQEYTTLREHLKVMYGLGKITEKNFNRINALANEGKDLSDADLALILQPMKPVYVANRIELHNDLNRRIYIKSSSFPLVPQLTRGLQIDNLRVAMEHPTTGVDRVSFGTAAKVGAPNNQLNIFDDNGDFNSVIDFSQTEVLTLSRSGFRIQQEVPYDKEKINVGTQERKLLFVNLLDTPGFNYKDKKNISGKELQEIYTDKYHKLFQLQHKSLMEELEFNEATGKVNTIKLQKLLKKEAIERDFPINDILGLELDRNGEFRIPLWLLPSTSRYESLLNAIVDNRVRKMKFNGASFILGSEEGFKEKPTVVTGDEAQDKIDELSSDIVYTDSWTGKLKGTTEHGMTQALIPFKFRDSNGELLDISKYTLKDKKNGKLMLDTNKLPKDLLKIFGFRIPTQGLNSMAQIEIVGFLPVSAGDLIITSKDFTKQMGSDFDVDKLYSYIYSHVTDASGAIHKITSDNIEQLINFSKSKSNKKEELGEKDILKLKQKFEMLALHNEILDIHHAVLENTHEDVRKQMLSPLGFGDLKDGKDLANLIASWKKARSGTQSFNGLSDSYQKQKFLNATDGKGGTGVFSLDSVFNSLVQGKDLHYIIEDTDGFNTFSVKFGNLESTGFLSDPKTLDGKKYKSDVIAAYQSASVDNEKEQILDKLNINSNTYDVIRILAQLGFDEETISAFTNQDIIVDLVKEIKLQKSSLYGYQPDLEATIIEQLTKKYTEGIDTKSESFINAVTAKKNISTSELMSYIQNGKTNDNFGYAAAQIASLSKFKQLTEYGKTLKRIQSAINTDSAGLGKSLFASIAKEESVRNLQNTPVKNAEKLIGNYTTINGKLEIEPTTINGFATVYGLFTNNSLWSKYFPYGHENIANIVTEINKVTSDKEMDTAQKEEVYKNVFGAIKSYLFTRKDLGVFDGDLKARREWLFKNLGKKINEFKLNKTKIFETNPFLNKLTTETDLKSGLRILKYNAVSLESFFEDSIYGGFLDLIQKNTEIADGYTTRQLADDFVQYAYLSGGKQQAVDFIRYIPIEYLNQLPFANKLRNINFSDTNVLDNVQRNDKTPYYQVSEFVKQYVQHNSRKAPEFPETTKVEYTNKEKTQFTLAKDAITLSKMPVFVNFNDKLWQFNGQNYTQISKLGGKYQIGEYDANSRGITSIVSKQNPKQLVSADTNIFFKADSTGNVIENTTKKPYEDVIVARNRKYMLESGSILNVLDAVSGLSKNPAYKRLASEYHDVIANLDYKIDIRLSDVNAFGRTSYNIDGKGHAKIEINNTKVIDSVEALEKTILHETTHALTKFLVMKYERDPESLTAQQREIVGKLDKFRLLYKARIGNELVDITWNKKEKGIPLSEEERNFYYPGSNLQEFTAAAMENEEFQKYLAKEIWQGEKSFLDKFFELVRDLMKSLGIKPGEDLNKYIYNDVLSLIKSQVKQEVIEQPIQNKEGIDFVFEQTPELSTVGTPEQYSAYISSIFPDSKVKDIVYHFSNVKIDKPNKEKFSLSANINRRKGFFGINKNINPGNNFANVEGTISHAMLFDMKNPDFGDFSIIPPVVAKDETKDSAIIKQRGDINYYAVFEPEQIHILGSKQDIEGFKKFVGQPIQNKETAESIYSKLGNKTKSGNVIIKSWGELKDATKPITNEGIISTRIKTTDYNFGNIFSHQFAGNLIKTDSVKEAVERYINWVITGETGEYVFTGIQPEEIEEKRAWLLEKLKSGELKGKPILYYKELGEPSHATALDYLINKYNWNVGQPINKEIKPNEIIGVDEQTYFNNPRIRYYNEQAKLIINSLPKVESGFTRLWRGSRKTDVNSNLTVTNSLIGIALPFMYQYEGIMQYVDIPTKDLNEYEQSKEKGHVVAKGSEFELTEDFKNKFKTVDSNVYKELEKQYPDKLIQDLNQPIEIKPKIDSSKRINIYAGTNENAELSNFAHRPFEIGGMFYDNVESAFQHAKLAFSDMITEQPLEIQSAKWNTLSGAKAKALGRKFVGLDTKEWDKQSSSIMKTLLTESFKQNINALETLRGTGSAELTHTQDKGKWGTEFPKLLMEVRDELKEGTRGEEPGFEDIIEKDYDFKYFGTTYEIVTTNGIATDVPSLKQSTSETNTKFQERKQKILDAYNENKDVDKQNGRKFRNLTINEEFHTVEKAPVVEKSESEKKSFTYKGRTIETAFELTDGQSNALKSLIDFSSNSSTTKAITLQGPAGTGKTATIGYLQKYLGGDSKLIYLAPTHAATAELAFATVKTGNKSLPLTAASGFRKSINKVTGEEEALMTKKLLDRLSYGNNILVIDEVSMLNSKDYALILETIKNKPNIKLIFMGDILQIPEVNTNNPDKKQVSRAFTEYTQVILSEVKRTSSNSILQILTNLRKYTNGLIPKVKNTEQVQYVDDNGFDQLIVETFKKDSENTVLISYTNAGVKATNHKIREVLGRTGDLKKNDIITGYLGYSSKQIEKGNIANSIRFKVEDVEKNGSEYIITASSEKLESLRKQGVSSVPTKFSGTYLQLSPTDAFTFDELTDDDFEENNKKLSVMMAELHTTKQAAIKNPRMWSTYYDLQTSIGAYFAKVNLGDDYIYNPKTDRMEKYDFNKHSKIDADLQIDKGIDYGHAITIHKSQGATFKNVFFDTATLPKGNSSKLYKGDDLISSEKHALIYVAMSRASDLLVVRASDSSLFYDVLERKNMPEATPQKELKPDIEETLEDFLPLNNKFSKNTSELTKNVLSLFETEDTIENYKNRCK